MKAADFKFDRSLFYLYQVLSQSEGQSFQDYMKYIGYKTEEEYQAQSPEEYQKVKDFFENVFEHVLIVSSHSRDETLDGDRVLNYSLDYELVGYPYIRMFRLDEEVVFIFFFKEA